MPRTCCDSGQRNAERFHGALLAVYVDQGELGGDDRVRLNANLELARRPGRGDAPAARLATS